MNDGQDGSVQANVTSMQVASVSKGATTCELGKGLFTGPFQGSSPGKLWVALRLEHKTPVIGKEMESVFTSMKLSAQMQVRSIGSV